jgi:hypothetical protein
MCIYIDLMMSLADASLAPDEQALLERFVVELKPERRAPSTAALQEPAPDQHHLAGGAVEKEPGHPWECLAALGVISRRSAKRLQEAKEMRDELGHAYPPATWRALHDGVHMLLSELDRYLDRLAGWAAKEEILPSS